MLGDAKEWYLRGHAEKTKIRLEGVCVCSRVRGDCVSGENVGFGGFDWGRVVKNDIFSCPVHALFQHHSIPQYQPISFLEKEETEVSPARDFPGVLHTHRVGNDVS